MNNYSKRILKNIIFFILILGISLGIYYYFHPIKTTLYIRDIPITIDVAITDSERQLGLGGRTSLPVDRGMLFVYPSSGIYDFWMKDMNFPLDFIWIKDNQVVDLTVNVPIMTNGEITRVKSKVEVNKILEVNAGFIKKYNIKIGDQVVIRN